MNEVLNDLSSLKWNKQYRVWEPFMRKYNCQIICEVGVRHGHNFEKMIEHEPQHGAAVDIWKDTGNIAENDKGYSQKQLDAQYYDFKKRVGNKPNVRILRANSALASKFFVDDFFDFVYLDADHSYEGVHRDISLWYPKVKKDGFLLGDDFVNHKTRTGVKYGVMDAVNKFTTENNLSYFVFPKHKWGLIKS